MIRLEQKSLSDDPIGVVLADRRKEHFARSTSCSRAPAKATVKGDARYAKTPILADYGLRCSRDDPRWK